MSIKEQIKSDLKTAMKEKDVAKRDTLRNIQALIKQIEVDERRDVNDDDMERILMKYSKQREDAMAQFKEAGREDLVAKEEAELSIIKTYLPEPMTDEELTATLQEIISNVGASSMKDMGKVMGIVSKQLAGKADGKVISDVVKQLLA